MGEFVYAYDISKMYTEEQRNIFLTIVDSICRNKDYGYFKIGENGRIFILELKEFDGKGK